ncbi:2-C-methyl-D-erythritol 4-phosphate cytidylyltransferase [Draconibacterium sp. IB214405]|uniref:2-C-methyl-D-erythritol 4-phosphate cytidylyltransferase n=1 Tax=Draconibacterium sp. IB214405 TaxID=3097352 RepID=UPI002A166096|nr:2-C-methyl-D-erythritol 4-phosphate cytidylyltransferase [Draconibacterium sp. IB214405]MDX8338028.1 2-C-methyl-D-erythritol 4-phosphate cytidylyltransferase [Draconibacterium sp. IB214405]
MLKKFALIVAGGSGNRMQASVPKQFLEIEGKPVLMYTFEAFLSFDPTIEFILVLPENQVEHWKELCHKHFFTINYKLAFGGENRFQSVKNGLAQINDDGIVFIHDGVRPLVAKETIEHCFSEAKKSGNALPVVPPSESVRYSDDSGNKAVDRSRYFLVQTPQTFDVQIIKEAYQKAQHENFTDDASVLENAGHRIHLVDGNRENIKITWPQDLIIAKSFLFPQ